MKKEFYLTFFLHIAIITVSFVNIVSTRKWMSSTGIIQITETPIYMMTLSCVSSMFSLLFLTCFYRTRFKIFPTASFIFSLPFLSVEFYFAYLMRYDIDKFLDQLIPIWANKHASAEVLFLQKKFKCCGYVSTTDFPQIECQGNYCTPCIEKIGSVLEKPLTGCGTYMFSNAVIRLISMITFWISYNMEEDPSIIEENEFIMN